MRPSGFLFVLLCGLVSVCAASDSARQGSPVAPANAFNSDRFDSSLIASHDFIQVPASDRVDRGFGSERDGDVTCYTMHIFEMKRESPRSDVTVPDGQWTCRRASKYGVKAVEELDEGPSR
jgi:hypothetical protein